MDNKDKSFLIEKSYLNGTQLDMIRNHAEIEQLEPFKKWVIEENRDYICGYTEVDSFGMHSYMKFAVGLDDDKIQWGDGLHSIKL